MEVFNRILVDGKTTPLYYHKTDGGAEYLSSAYIECPNGHREGTFTADVKVLLRVDGGELEIIKIA